MNNKKSRSYCTNEAYWNELEPAMKKVYKALSEKAGNKAAKPVKNKKNKNENKKNKKNKKNNKLTKQAVAQLIQQGQFATDYHTAVMLSFGIESKTLTKPQRKVAKICFKISQSKYMAKLYTNVLLNDKAHASLKVIAEIKGLIDNSGNNNNLFNTTPNLSINLSTEPTQKPPEEDNKDNLNTIKSPPLDLMMDN